MKISPVQQLNDYAKAMLVSVVNDSPAQKRNIGNFLQFANDTKLYGAAVVSYHTAYNMMTKKASHFTKEAKERLYNADSIIEKHAKGSPLLKQKAELFEENINNMYPNSLADRVSLAATGSVQSEIVEPKSRFKKFLVWINRLVNTDV